MSNKAHAVIIDDDANNVGVLGQMLTLEGVSCTTVLNPMQMEGVLKGLPQVDVIFLDLEMPGMNGYEALQAIKQQPRFQDVPVVAYTVHFAEINTAYQQGFHSFLPKPLDQDRFPEQLARILNGERIWS
jgi:two-component system cell cycle response regulator DivK